jgi:GT2 family glycosyltransferase
VVQKWVSIGKKSNNKKVREVTVESYKNNIAKFIILNSLLREENLENYDFLIICDDDVILPENFLDRYLEYVKRYDFSLAQPARTHNSFIDHHFVECLDGLVARRTRFVEIGPVLSIRKDAYDILLPFDETSYMGWGYDFVWPYFIEKAGLKMGIVDAVPVDHSIRKPVKNYEYSEANISMQKYLSKNPHLSKDEAFVILESYV